MLVASGCFRLPDLVVGKSIRQCGRYACILRDFLADVMKDDGFCLGHHGCGDEHAWGTFCKDSGGDEADGCG